MRGAKQRGKRVKMRKEQKRRGGKQKKSTAEERH